MPKKILVVRNDKLGDFMLSWPSLALLKKALPQCKLEVLVPHYTRPLAEHCQWIDGVIDDPGPGAGLRQFLRLISTMRSRRYDAVITLFSTGRIGIATWLSGIPYRLAPATKWAQACYNHRLLQSRSRSLKPEWEYNQDLVKFFLGEMGIPCPTSPEPPYLVFPEKERLALRKELDNLLETDRRHQFVFIHPGSGGSATNLSPAQYARLALALQPTKPVAFVLTAGPGEAGIAEHLGGILRSNGRLCIVHRSERGLVAFALLLSCADLFISGSTGPLHIAGALNLPTVGFYPHKRSSTSLRWQTLSAEKNRLAFSPPTSLKATDMDGIDLEAAALEISRRFL
ncbi:MAG: lipopolysaccharide heptosyltransferase family protein [Proteobacteria bacterium]|nr:MAG: lipopolysaccharide heptosyltransferase family protein [Pseudomonadota bacterium]QKK12565.1 MAG: glycosyltransferase family 9 protein [Pseudomonadota bacterium]